jgi:hypothetical protein
MSAYRMIVTLASLGLAVIPLAASADHLPLTGMDPTAIEIAMLPKFCWGQYYRDKFKGPEFNIPRSSCGPGMNHYCPGLIALGRANRSLEDKWKQGYLQGAEGQVRYTLRAMEKYPYCPLRSEVHGTYNLIERELSTVR